MLRVREISGERVLDDEAGVEVTWVLLVWES